MLNPCTQIFCNTFVHRRYRRLCRKISPETEILDLEVESPLLDMSVEQPDWAPAIDVNDEN